MKNSAPTFTQATRQALYDVIFNRRDVRGEFKSDPIDQSIIARLLIAAHHAPSVGFMQPWNFLLINETTQRLAVRDLFDKANKEAAEMFKAEKQELYKSLKLEGLATAPLHICVTCDRDRAGKVVLGRTHMHDMDIYSTVCAVQNLWLAARAENIGVGWVSIFHEDEVKALLGIPPEIQLIAYLTVGHVSAFNEQPELAKKGWRKRLNLNELIMQNKWAGQPEKDIQLAVTNELNKLAPDGSEKTKS